MYVGLYSLALVCILGSVHEYLYDPWTVCIGSCMPFRTCALVLECLLVCPLVCMAVHLSFGLCKRYLLVCLCVRVSGCYVGICAFAPVGGLLCA